MPPLPPPQLREQGVRLRRARLPQPVDIGHGSFVAAFGQGLRHDGELHRSDRLPGLLPPGCQDHVGPAFEKALLHDALAKLLSLSLGADGRDNAVGRGRRDLQASREIPVDPSARENRRVLVAFAGQGSRLLQIENGLPAETAGERKLDDVLVVRVSRHPVAGEKAFDEGGARDEMAEESFEARRRPGRGQREPEWLLRQSRAQQLGVVNDRLRRRRQNQVLAPRIPALDGGKRALERRVNGANRFGIHLVGLQPLQEDAARRETSARGPVELLREEARDAGPVGVRRLGKDDVVTLPRGEEVLARIADHDAHPGILENVPVDRRAGLGDMADHRLELHDVHAFDRRHAGQPARRGSRAEADNEGATRRGMKRRADQPAHDLGGSVGAGVAVDLSAHGEGEAAARRQHRHARFDPVGFPEGPPALVSHPLLHAVGRGVGEIDAAGADRTVPPGRGRPGQANERDAGSRGSERNSPARKGALLTPARDEKRRDRESGEQQGHENPGAGSRQQRQQPEAPGERPQDRARRVPGVRETHVRSDLLASPSQQ